MFPLMMRILMDKDKNKGHGISKSVIGSLQNGLD